jgi:hypothetical protein
LPATAGRNTGEQAVVLYCSKRNFLLCEPQEQWLFQLLANKYRLPVYDTRCHNLILINGNQLISVYEELASYLQL